MNTATAKSFLTILTSRVGVERERLYQLVRTAEVYYRLKDGQGQHKIGTLLQAYDYPFNVIGEYYDAFYLNQIGRVSEAKYSLEKVIEYGTPEYRAKAILTLSGVEEMQGNFEESMRLRLKVSCVANYPVAVEAQLGIAAIMGVGGSHRQAVAQLEKFLPMARLVGEKNPLYMDFLNSYAVELGDSGRLEEARQVVNVVLADTINKIILNPYLVELVQNTSKLKSKRQQKVVLDTARVLAGKDKTSKKNRK